MPRDRKREQKDENTNTSSKEKDKDLPLSENSTGDYNAPKRALSFGRQTGLCLGSYQSINCPHASLELLVEENLRSVSPCGEELIPLRFMSGTRFLHQTYQYDSE